MRLHCLYLLFLLAVTTCAKSYEEYRPQHQRALAPTVASTIGELLSVVGGMALFFLFMLGIAFWMDEENDAAGPWTAGLSIAVVLLATFAFDYSIAATVVSSWVVLIVSGAVYVFKALSKQFN